jgi:hypothetical protein
MAGAPNSANTNLSCCAALMPPSMTSENTISETIDVSISVDTKEDASMVVVWGDCLTTIDMMQYIDSRSQQQGSCMSIV